MMALESQTEQMFSAEIIPITSNCQAHIFEWVQARVDTAGEPLVSAFLSNRQYPALAIFFGEWRWFGVRQQYLVKTPG
jgi:hypothetical protein